MHYGDIYCDIVFIGGFEAYCCMVSLWGVLEQNIVGVTLVVQNFSEIFCIDFVGLFGSKCILRIYQTSKE